jgi:V/A-type H+-transporting ATPase subunit E
MIMTTVDDKLKLFAKIVFEKVEKESAEKVADSTKNHDQLLEIEKQNIMKEADNLIRQTKKKAEDKRKQIISKANIERQHTLLKKRKEIFDRTVEDIKGLAVSFTGQNDYLAFLEKCIKNALSQMDAKNADVLVTKLDAGRYHNEISVFLGKYKKQDMTVNIHETDEEILGGCILEDIHKTIRIDCSMASIIDDNKVLIGNMLMDNLQ